MKSLSLNVKGIQTHFSLTNPQAEKVFFFLHGWGGTLKSFEKILQELPKDIQGVCLDLPGFGKSDFPPMQGWTTHDYADWLFNFLEAFSKNHKLPAKSYFYGHSFGCRVLVRFTQKHPQRVEKLILTGAAGIKWPKTYRQNFLSFVARTLKPFVSLKPSPERHDFIGKIQRKTLRLFGAHDWESCPENLRPTLTKVLAEEDFRMELKNIHIPTLLLWGGKDTYTPLRSAKVYHEYLPQNKLVIFPEGRHGIHYTQAPEITRLIQDFL